MRRTRNRFYTIDAENEEEFIKEIENKTKSKLSSLAFKDKEEDEKIQEMDEEEALSPRKGKNSFHLNDLDDDEEYSGLGPLKDLDDNEDNFDQDIDDDMLKQTEDDLIRKKFTDEEIEMIPSINISAGNSTTDRVFLLSIYEVNTYLSSDSARQCQATAFCYNASTDSDSKENCWWWLRSTGYSPIFAAGVDSLGGIDYDGFHVITCDRCVRPAMWIELGS